MFDMPKKIRDLQDALRLDDKSMADYLGVDVTGLREAKGGTQDLSSHGAAIVLDSLGFVTISDAVLALLTKKSREKFVTARARQALSIAQKKSLRALKQKYQDDIKES